VEKFAHGRAEAPYFRLPNAAHSGVVKFPHEGRQHVAARQVKVIVRAVEDGRLRGDEVAPVLGALTLAKFDSCDFCNGVVLVGGLKGSRQLLILGDWLN
jgi:hypothetical protein